MRQKITAGRTSHAQRDLGLRIRYAADVGVRISRRSGVYVTRTQAVSLSSSRQSPAVLLSRDTLTDKHTCRHICNPCDRGKGMPPSKGRGGDERWDMRGIPAPDSPHPLVSSFSCLRSCDSPHLTLSPSSRRPISHSLTVPSCTHKHTSPHNGFKGDPIPLPGHGLPAISVLLPRYRKRQQHLN